MCTGPVTIFAGVHAQSVGSVEVRQQKLAEAHQNARLHEVDGDPPLMVLGYRPTWACPAPVHRASTTPTSAQAASTPSSSTAAGGSCPSGPPGLGRKLPDISFLPDDGVVSPPTSPPAAPTPGEEPPPSEVFQYTFSEHPQRASASAVIHSKGEEPRVRRKSIAEQNAEYYAQQKQRPSGCGYRPSCAFPTMRSFVSKCLQAAEEPFMIGVESSPDSPPPSAPASPVRGSPTSSLHTLPAYLPWWCRELALRGPCAQIPSPALLTSYPLSPSPNTSSIPAPLPSQPSDESKEHFNAFASDDFRLPAQYRRPPPSQAALPLLRVRARLGL
jgi:hypothetical protein